MKKYLKMIEPFERKIAIISDEEYEIVKKIDENGDKEPEEILNEKEYEIYNRMCEKIYEKYDGYNILVLTKENEAVFCEMWG